MSPTEINEILNEINIRLDKIDDKELSAAIFALLQLIERLSQENEKLKADNQRLRDENNLLKGEQGKPKIRGNTNKGKDVSSEAERKEKKKGKKSKAKKHKIKIDRIEICKVDRSELPEDAEFKGYEDVVVQETVIKTDNVEYFSIYDISNFDERSGGIS